MRAGAPAKSALAQCGFDRLAVAALGEDGPVFPGCQPYYATATDVLLCLGSQPSFKRAGIEPAGPLTRLLCRHGPSPTNIKQSSHRRGDALQRATVPHQYSRRRLNDGPGLASGLPRSPWGRTCARGHLPQARVLHTRAPCCQDALVCRLSVSRRVVSSDCPRYGYLATLRVMALAVCRQSPAHSTLHAVAHRRH